MMCNIALVDAIAQIVSQYSAYITVIWSRICQILSDPFKIFWIQHLHMFPRVTIRKSSKQVKVHSQGPMVCCPLDVFDFVYSIQYAIV